MLMNKYMPVYHKMERHEILVRGSLEACYKNTVELDLSASRVVSFLFKLRGLPYRQHIFKDFTSAMNFTLLEEQQYTEQDDAAGHPEDAGDERRDRAGRRDDGKNGGRHLDV